MACEPRGHNEQTSLENRMVIKDFLLLQTETFRGLTRSGVFIDLLSKIVQ